MQLNKMTYKTRINAIWHRYGTNMEIDDPGISCKLKMLLLCFHLYYFYKP